MNLTEVVSCDKSLLQENEQVDGILHEGKMFGGEKSWMSCQDCRVDVLIISHAIISQFVEPRISSSFRPSDGTPVEAAAVD